MYQWLTIGDSEIRLYYLLNDISVVAVLLFNLACYGKKKDMLGLHSKKLLQVVEVKMPRLKAVIGVLLTILEIVLISYFQYYWPIGFTGPFGKLVGTGANYFGMIFPVILILLLICVLLRINPLEQIDLITPAFPLALISGKIACFCAGCCRGFACSWGLYNHVTEQFEFPVQLVEAGLALAIFIFLLYWRKKAKPGTMFPTYLILYSGTRFFSEFLRCEPEVFWIFKTYHILCIIGVIVGFAELFLVLKFGDKISQFDLFNILKKLFEAVKAFFIQKIWSKIKKVFSAYKEKRAKKKREKEKRRQKERIVHHHNKRKKKRRSKKH